MNAEQKIEFTKQNIIDAANLKEPKKIPVTSWNSISGWAFNYAGIRFDEVWTDPVAITDNFIKIYEDMPHDSIYTSGSFATVPLRMQKALGIETYAIAEDGTSITHNQAGSHYLGPEVYDEIIADPMTFMNETCYKKTVPAFSGTKEQAIDGIKKAYTCHKADVEAAMMIGQRQAELGYYSLLDDSRYFYFAPFNNFFDNYRGIKDALIDIRRYHSKVKDACDAIWESQAFMREFDPEDLKNPLPIFNTIYHSECFLSRKLFEEFYWSYFKKDFAPALEQGKKMFLYGEGSFLNTIDFYNDLPKGSMLLMLDVDDPIEANKIVGGHQTIVGGIDISMLAMNTKEECLNRVRQVFDALAPGGGFMFTPNRTLINSKEAKKENLLAVYELANELSWGK